MMKRFAPSFLVLLVATTLLSGCATIFSGTSDEISFESEPEGAGVYIDGVKRGETPATVSVSRDVFNDTFVTLKMDGYEDRRIRLQKDFTTVSILNLGNVLFWGIDAATGAMMNYSMRHYDVELDAEEQAHLLKDLPRDAQGRYVIPDGEQSVSVTDKKNGLRLIFSKK